MGHLDSLFFLNVSSPGWADTVGRFSATRCRYASSEEENAPRPAEHRGAVSPHFSQVPPRRRAKIQF